MAGMEIPYRLLRPGAVVPTRGRDGDAGYDLVACDAHALLAGQRALVDTGVAVALPVGWCALVVPRSGLALKHGIGVVNAPGLIDANYRDAIGVILENRSREPFAVRPGDRVAQLLLVEHAAPTWRAVDDLPDSDRGRHGFGSSGR